MTITLGVAQSELIAALSIAGDLGMGQPEGQSLRTCLLALGVAREMGLSETQCADIYFFTLLRFAGCNSHADQDARAAGGDERAFRRTMAPVLAAEPAQILPHVIRNLGSDLPARRRAAVVAGMLVSGPKHAREGSAATCEVARMFASQLGLGSALIQALGFQFEYWNGKGMPNGVSGEAIPIAARVGMVARDVDVVTTVGGRELADEVLRRRRGRAYDPKVADAFRRYAWRVLPEIKVESLWTDIIEADPTSGAVLEGERLTTALETCAHFADIKCWFTRDHSPLVSSVAGRAAGSLGLSPIEVEATAAAGLVQEMGRTGIPNGILELRDTLTSSQWDAVKQSTYLIQRILGRCRGLDLVTSLAMSHHERLDGSGYHRGIGADRIPPGARILAAADAFKAMTTDRPWRPKLAPAEVVRQLSSEVKAGRLAHDAVDAVLSAAGHEALPRRQSGPAGLTDREIEVLRLISLGRTNRDVAQQLFISPKTVGRHIENIYAKVGVSTRPAATLYAMQHRLLS